MSYFDSPTELIPLMGRLTDLHGPAGPEALDRRVCEAQSLGAVA